VTAPRFLRRGAPPLAYHRGIGSEVAGALEVFDQHPGLEVVPAWGARGNASGGTIPAADFRRLAGEFLGAVRTAGPVDAAYFALHGALAADGEDDPEGHLLEEARKVLGERVPVVASFDLHGVSPAPNGDSYSYCVDKCYRVMSVRPHGMVVVRTRRGRQRTLAADDPALRRARRWERFLFGWRFPTWPPAE
jgi:hypothetical protein